MGSVFLRDDQTIISKDRLTKLEAMEADMSKTSSGSTQTGTKKPGGKK